MSSSQAQRSISTKPANVQPASVPSSSAQPSLDVSAPRRAGGSPAGTPSVRNLPSPRNIQSRKQQHKRHRRPRLADEDAIAESVGSPPSLSLLGLACLWGIKYKTHLMNRPGSHEVDNQPQGPDVHHPFDELCPSGAPASPSTSPCLLPPCSWCAESSVGVSFESQLG
jgi:hypothetical protein